MISGWVLVFVLAGAFLAVAIVVGVWLNGISESKARDAAARFGAALVHNDPRLAPSGDGDYVRGVRAYFGPVTSARVIGAHSRHVNTFNRYQSREFSVAELAMSTRRGPAVLEFEFTFFTKRLTSIHELQPSAAPGLTGAQRDQLASAVAARGGKLADDITLSDASAATQTAPASAGESSAQPDETALARAQRVLRCVQRAGGDSAKLQQCARS
jgi:hypothetical protein